MCGNFGLLLLAATPSDLERSRRNQNSSSAFIKQYINHNVDPLDQSLQRSLHEVSVTNGIRITRRIEDSIHLTDGNDNKPVQDEKRDIKLLQAIRILEAQTSATEIRGGQAGGYSSFQYEKVEASSAFDKKFGLGSCYNDASITRVRCVARKRHPLAKDLSNLFESKANDSSANGNITVTVIGHTRFATSSMNKIPELHPHEWIPSHTEKVWMFNNTVGKFEKINKISVLHLTHNGDFDALQCYNQVIPFNEIGKWLNIVSYTTNDLKGDSPKIAGLLDIFRVQGRWAASARLAYIKCILDDIVKEQQSFPDMKYFEKWDKFIEKIWLQHMNNIIQVVSPTSNQNIRQFRYRIEFKSEKLFIQHMCDYLTDASVFSLLKKSTISESIENKLFPSFLNNLNESFHDLSNSYHSAFDDNYNYEDLKALRHDLMIESWTSVQLKSFIITMVRSFLRSDLYNAMTEFLSRAEGSFGLQGNR